VASAAIRARGAGTTTVCGACGYAAKGPNPAVKCPVCGAGADQFQVIDSAELEGAAARQGGAASEEPLPGVTVRWATEARDALGEVRDSTLRRRAQDRVEKHARSRRLPVITLEVAVPLIEETAGRGSLGAGWQSVRARLAGGAPVGAVTWTAEAEARLERVPSGFMREMTRQEIEKAARAAGITTIDLGRCEEWMVAIRATMCQARGTRAEAGA